MPIHNQADLSQYPINAPMHQTSGAVVTLGDMHGNAIAFMWKLIDQGFIEFASPEDYTKAKKLYDLNWKNDSWGKYIVKLRQADEYKTIEADAAKEAMTEYKEILSHIKPGKNKDKASLRLLGDLVADRGNNDIMTLLLLQRIKTLGVSVEITASNHDALLLANYLHNPTKWQGRVSIYNRSFNNLVDLIEKDIVTHQEVIELIEKTYLPSFKLLSYVLEDNDQNITIFMHGPAVFSSIEELAIELGIEYKGGNAIELAATIKGINDAFQLLFHQNPEQFSKMLYDAQIGGPHDRATPLSKIIWTYNMEDYGDPEDTISSYPAYVKKVVHGHCTEQYAVRQESDGRDENLDTDLGKGEPRDEQGTYAYCQTIEPPLKDFVFNPEAGAGRNFRQ